MAADRSVIGNRTPAHTVLVERGRLRSFARATGQTDPVYTDPQAAAAAGHRDLPVPPTFLFCLEMEQPRQWGYLRDLGIDPRTILHAGQAFTYHALAYAGDELTFTSQITDVYDKKGGALTFLVRTTEARRAGDLLASLVSTVVLRTGGVA